MTDLEKLSRPVVYEKLKGFSTLLYSGHVLEGPPPFIKYHFCKDYDTQVFTHVRCYSWLDNHCGVIAEFKFKKLHDTKRKSC